MNYRIEEEVPAVQDCIQIRLAAGLSRKSPEAAVIGLKNGLFSVGFEPSLVPRKAGMSLRIV